jgi:endonuclease YncB( thermonuclease family)
MRSFLLLLVFLTVPLCAFAAPQEQEKTLTFEKVIDGATIVASGKTVALWGVKALDPADPASFAANLYLETMLKKGALHCEEKSVEGDRHIMHCTIDAADVGSLMVQMGMARAADPYYQVEEAYAQAQQRGVWQRKQGAPL